MTLGFVLLLILSSFASSVEEDKAKSRNKKQNPKSTLLHRLRRSPLGEGAKGLRQIAIYLPSQSRKSAFRRANNEITEGLPSGGALVCGEHWQALGYEVSRAYKRRFIILWRFVDVPVLIF